MTRRELLASTDLQRETVRPPDAPRLRSWEPIDVEYRAGVIRSYQRGKLVRAGWPQRAADPITYRAERLSELWKRPDLEPVFFDPAGKFYMLPRQPWDSWPAIWCKVGDGAMTHAWGADWNDAPPQRKRRTETPPGDWPRAFSYGTEGFTVYEP